jgi:hypothetical protein
MLSIAVRAGSIGPLSNGLEDHFAVNLADGG